MFKYEKEERRLITQMNKRKEFFEKEIRELKLTNMLCPCCGFPTQSVGESQPCMICGWGKNETPFAQVTLIEKQISTEREVNKILESEDLFIFEVLFNTYFDPAVTTVTKEYLKNYVTESI